MLFRYTTSWKSRVSASFCNVVASIKVVTGCTDASMESFSISEESFSLPTSSIVSPLLHPKITIEKNSLARTKKSSVFNIMPRGEVSMINSTKFILEEATLMTELEDLKSWKQVANDRSKALSQVDIGQFKKNHREMKAKFSSWKKNLVYFLSYLSFQVCLTFDGELKWVFPEAQRVYLYFLCSPPRCSCCFQSLQKNEEGVVNFKTFSSDPINFFSISDFPLEFLNHMSIKISFYHFKMNCWCHWLTFDFFVTF